MDKALVIVHADKPFLEGRTKHEKIKVECLKDLIHAETCRYIRDGNPVYYAKKTSLKLHTLVCGIKARLLAS